ncbi:hypothetical protein glysoja_039881, partial [Glycine soja]
RPDLRGVCFGSLEMHQNDMLVGQFLEEEIRTAMWDCGSDKSPSPDGLNFKFIKHFWELIKPDISKFIAEF